MYSIYMQGGMKSGFELMKALSLMISELYFLYLTPLSFRAMVPSNRQPQLATSYRHHENLKRAYEQRIHDVERGSFTPLVLSATGGLGRAATVTYRRLASLLSTKSMGLVLQHHHGLAPLSPVLFSAVLLHSLH